MQNGLEVRCDRRPALAAARNEQGRANRFPTGFAFASSDFNRCDAGGRTTQPIPNQFSLPSSNMTYGFNKEGSYGQ